MTKNKNKAKNAAKKNPANGKTFYSESFTTEELALVAASLSDPTLDDELWLQRVLNQRLFRKSAEAAEGGPIALELLVKVAEALTRGTGRVARLLRDQRALSGAAADGISGAIATTLDEISTELGVKL